MYGIEKVARKSGLSPEARKDLRQQHAPLMLDRLHLRLLELDSARVGSPVLPKSPLGKAIRYKLNQWEALVRYLEYGRYETDTNLVENAIQPSCGGKRNWLFIGHPDAGLRSAVIYSLLITARRYRLDPQLGSASRCVRSQPAPSPNCPNFYPGTGSLRQHGR
jgi:hypothetical protein